MLPHIMQPKVCSEVDEAGAGRDQNHDLYHQQILNFVYHDFHGKISNFRIVKGTGVCTTTFKPPTEPLTNITNTKLLCCNNSSTTGSTVTPGTITANGDPTASTTDPFGGSDYSVDFDGTGDYLSWPSTTDFSFGVAE